MLIKSIVNIQNWAESERKFRKWEHIVIRGHQQERSMFVRMATNGVIWGRGVKFEWTWNFETVESEPLAAQTAALIPEN